MTVRNFVDMAWLQKQDRPDQRRIQCFQREGSMFSENTSSHNRVSKLTTFSLAILILALIPIGAFAMGGGPPPTCAVEGAKCRDLACCVQVPELTCEGSGGGARCVGPPPEPPPITIK